MTTKTNTTNTPKKLIVGWFSFTCSEDSTILLTEILNDMHDDLKQLVEFRYFKALKSKNELRDLDVAFIEGAISSESQAKRARTIRENAKYVVAIGACACTGMPSASRNKFVAQDITEEIGWYMKKFNYNDKVKKLADVIKVDDMVHGCPMNKVKFLETLFKYLQLFGVVEKEN